MHLESFRKKSLLFFYKTLPRVHLESLNFERFLKKLSKKVKISTPCAPRVFSRVFNFESFLKISRKKTKSLFGPPLKKDFFFFFESFREFFSRIISIKNVDNIFCIISSHENLKIFPHDIKFGKIDFDFCFFEYSFFF